MKQKVVKLRCARCGKMFKREELAIHAEYCPILDEPEPVEKAAASKPELTYRQQMEKQAARFPAYRKYLGNPDDDIYGWRGTYSALIRDKRRSKPLKAPAGQ